jgi:Rieske Fe-S protein
MTRNRPVIVVFAVLAAAVIGPAVAGCKSSTGSQVAAASNTVQPAGSASAGPRPAADLRVRAQQMERCLRDHGYVPNANATAGDGGNDPQHSDGGPQVGAAKAAYGKAVEACRIYEPDGGVPYRPSAADIERLRQYSRCMREHGVPEFPDPDPETGALLDDGSDYHDPNFVNADKTCAHLGPQKTGSGG